VSPLVRELSGSSAQFALPAKLSPKAQRDVLIRSGKEIEVDQVFAIPNLMELSVEERLRLVEVAENVTVDCDVDDPAEIQGPWSESVITARVDRYGELRLGNKGRWLRVRESGDLQVDEVFYATPNHTINAQLRFESTLGDDDVAAFRAMLGGAPLVTEIPEGSALAVEHVLGAYERAIRLADGFIQVVDEGVHAADVFFLLPISKMDEGIVFLPDPDSEAMAAAILLEASPEAHAAAERLYEHLQAASPKELIPLADRFCGNWWKSPWVDKDDATKLKNLSWELWNLAQQQARLKKYELDRAAWINVSGSQQLRRAAVREYRHDGIYRDERLAAELPGFVANVGRKPNIRDLINPSADALELEDQVLAQARLLSIADDQVRLVWLDPDNDMPAGEYLRIQRYLGRHTVWRPVDPDSEADDFPF
jgi:hypothetical protein